MARIAHAFERLLARSKLFAQTWGAVVEEQKTVIWLIGTASSALAGWAVYSARCLHYAKIEHDMHDIVELINRNSDRIRKFEEEDLAERIEAAQERLAAKTLGEGGDGEPWWKNPTKQTWMVIAPAVCSAFLLGYMVGRTSTSFKIQKQARLMNVLHSKKKVYVAVIPEDQFEPRALANSLHKAVSETAEKKAAKPWMGSRLSWPFKKPREPSPWDWHNSSSSRG